MGRRTGDAISTVDFRPGIDTGAIAFDLQYTGTSMLDKIVIPENGPPTPTTATIDLNYGTSGISTGLLTEVRDGVTSTGALDGWDITYAQSGASGNLQTRVSTITAPDGGSPTTTPTPWTFRYHAPWYGMRVGGVCITDPRQTPTTNCDAETVNDDPYETQIEFSTAGYPIERYAPIDPGQTSAQLRATRSTTTTTCCVSAPQKRTRSVASPVPPSKRTGRVQQPR